MKTAWARTICRLLVALMIWTPYQMATAGMIGTDQVATATPAQSDRAAVLEYLSRGDVQSRLQAMAVDPSTAKDRVAALSHAEASSLAQRINTMPAGASDAGAVLLLVIVVAAVWWFFFRK